MTEFPIDNIHKKLLSLDNLKAVKLVKVSLEKSEILGKPVRVFLYEYLIYDFQLEVSIDAEHLFPEATFFNKSEEYFKFEDYLSFKKISYSEHMNYSEKELVEFFELLEIHLKSNELKYALENSFKDISDSLMDQYR